MGPTTTFLGREPVLWTTLIRALLPLAVLFGVDLSPEQIAGIILGVEAVLAFITRTAVTSNVAVVERETHGSVIAGPANDRVVEGEVIRRVDVEG